jgi:hypothetical protein
MGDHRCEYQGLHVMFVAFAVECFAEVQCLLPPAELDFHRPTRPVYCHELADARFFFAEVGQHEMPTIPLHMTWGQTNNYEDLSFTATYDAGNRVKTYHRADSYPGARETQSWNYDGAGNWNSTTIDGTAQARTHSASDQLEAIAGDNLTYDPRGNQLTDNRGNAYTWDLDNRIVEADGTGYSNIEYRYDALGRRIVREQGTSKEVLLWWNNTEQSEHKHQIKL